MFLMRGLLRTVVPPLVIASLMLLGCGAKSGLRRGTLTDAGLPDSPIVDTGPDTPEVDCTSDADCILEDRCILQSCRQGKCVTLPRPACGDADECTEDRCVPESGECEFRALSRDEDGDGYKGPRPGTVAGEPGSCGDDCDDTSAAAHPGGVEICDGVDNDCNGIVDDNMAYEPVGTEPVLVSSGGHKQAGRGGIVHNGKYYATTYTGQKESWRNYFKGLAQDGSTAIAETAVTNVVGDVFTGPLVWTGGMFGTAWEDRREGNNYEIWFNRLDSDGNKLGPDQRITNAIGFSLHASMLWNGSEFLLAWDDDRTDWKRVYGQRISADGALLGDNSTLTPDFMNAESPSIAEGERTLAIAFNMGDVLGQQVALRIFAPDLTSPGELVVLGLDEAVAPSVIFSGGRYIVAWEKKGALPGDAIWGAAVSEDGVILQSERRMTSPAQFARTQSMLPLGDRLLLVWGEYVNGNYELFSKMLSTTLEDLSAASPITSGTGDSLGPATAFGPDGDVGVLFGGTESGNWQVYFTRLECTAGS